MANLLEQCQIHPSPAPQDHALSLPLTQFDIPFLLSGPTQRLLFLDFSCSKSHFLKIIIPNLKNSLSLTLKHFLPLAGNIIIPSNSDMPVTRYMSGDSVSLMIVESDKDFDHLIGNHQRVADEFYAYIPHLPQTTRSSDSEVTIPVLSIQITLFPEKGICIGLTNHHSIADESSFIHFVKTWSLLNKLDENNEQKILDEKSLPDFDRTLVQDPEGLDSISWNLVKKSRPFPVEINSPPSSLNNVRATFIMTKSDIKNLKKYVMSKRPNICHMSSFTVICAYVLTCLERSLVTIGMKVNENETLCFLFAAECRARLSPVSLPSTYFGNCVICVIAELKHGEVKEDEGFLIAVETIGKAIKETLYSDKRVLECADWPVDFGRFRGKRVVYVSGSPRFDVYGVDFGWGRLKKYEFVNLERDKSMSLCRSREFEGGFEIGLLRNKIEMDAFEDIFTQGLKTREFFG